MKSTFTKQITSQCRLDFSNCVQRQSKPLFYPKNIPQNPLTFKKPSQQNLTFKTIESNPSINHRKSPLVLRPFCKKESLKKFKNRSIRENVLSNHKSESQFQIKNQYLKTSFGQNLKTEKSHQSLENQRQRCKLPTRNLIQQLKNYKSTRKNLFFKHQRVQTCSPSKQIINRSPPNIIPNQFCFKPIKEVFETKTIQFNTYTPRKTIIPQVTIFQPQLIRSLQQIKFVPPKLLSQLKQPVPYRQSLNSPIKNIKNSQVDQKEIKLIKQLPGRKQTIRKFRQKFGQIDLSESIMYDLIVSQEVQQASNVTKEISKIGNSINKPFQSDGSTILPPQDRLKKLVSEGPFSRTKDMVRNQIYESTDKETLHRICQISGFQHKNKYKTAQRMGFSNDKDQQFQQELSFQLVDSSEFRKRCEQRESFKSIISVMSEAGSSHPAHSIIIDNYPNELMKSKPIRSLF